MDRLKDIDKETAKRLKSLRSLCYQPIADIRVSAHITSEPVPPGCEKELSYKPIKPGYYWAKHVYDCAWFRVQGRVPASAAGKHVVLFLDLDGEAVLYQNGKSVQMVTSKAQYTDFLSAEAGKCILEIAECAAGGEEIDFYLDAGFNGQRTMVPFGMGKFKSAYLAVANDEMIDAFYDYMTVAALAPTAEDGEELTRLEAQAYSLMREGKAEETKALLSQVINGTPADCTLTAIGHSHLDLAWLWPIRETKRKAVRTFTMQMNNLARFDDYIYGASQPWQFEQVKERDGALFEKLKKAAADGRFELQGGMYVEPDTNISSGEALVRQLFYGKSFFRDEFGENMRICWLPDVFGYNGNLPQILKKSDIPYFFTIKLSWNEHNRFPNRSFVWKGIDGSDVLVHMAPDESYNSDASPISTKRAWRNFPEKDICSEAMYVFGIGDGGGGPSRAHIELIKRQASLQGTPKIRFGRAVDFFDRLNTQREKLPEYSGELYLEKHQGTYTTQGKNKRFNRKTEFALQNLEALASYAMLKGYTYPQEKLDKWWKEALLYQFHDILPGSSINRVYRESCARYAQILSEIETERNHILRFLSGEGSEKLFFNPSPFVQKGIAPWGFGKAENVDAHSLSADGNTISNGILTAVFDRGGEITSLKDRGGTEFAAGGLNRFKVFFDRPLYFNAWDIWWKYHEQKGRTVKAYRHENAVEGDRAVRRSYYRFGFSTMVQEVSLRAGEDVLRFDTKINWHNLFRMLRTEFRPGIDPDKVKCDIQFGSLMRSARDNTDIEKAQFEICAQKYVDISENGKGFSLLNDCKYGHRVKNGMISLNLLRSTIFPDPKADRGINEFSYEVYPHSGEAGADTVSRAYALNKPLIAFEGSATPQFSVCTENKNILVETVKKAYGSDDIVIRLYESSGSAQQTALHVPFVFDGAYECNLMEEHPSETDISKLSFAPFEIKTLIFSNPKA